MDLDRKAIKALAADTRMDILKSLNRRRKLPSELSRSLKLAPSTVIEHLKILEEAGLVSKTPHGPKWVYYELTPKAHNIIEPSTPFRFIFTLIIGAGMTLLGGFSMFTAGLISFSGGYMSSQAVLVEAAEAAPTADMATAASGLFTLQVIFGIILVIGLALLAYSLYRIKK